MIRILLADDHRHTREGLHALLEREGLYVVALAADGDEAVRKAAEHRPDVALIDVAIAERGGIETAREIQRVSHRTRTVLLTMQVEAPFVFEAAGAGLRGIVLKTQAASELARAVRIVAAGGIHLSSGVRAKVMPPDAPEPPPDTLTPRERLVLRLLAEGKTTREVAFLLGARVGTVEAHRLRAMKKLRAQEATVLVRYAVRGHIGSP